MTAPAPPENAVRRLLDDGSDEDLAGFVRLLTAQELADLLLELPEEDCARIADVLALKELLGVVQALRPGLAADVLEQFPPQVAADLLEELDEDVRNAIFQKLELAEQAEVLREVVDEEAREEILEALPDADLADIIEQHRSDDATDLFEELDDERAERILGEMEAERRAEIERLHAYPPESAGGLMQTELLRLNQDLTVQQAMNLVRREYDPRMGDVYDLYVVDDDGGLLGRVRNRHLVISHPDTPIEQVMIKDVATVPVTMDQEEIAQVVQDYDVPSVAVVDDDDRLLGRILFDDIVDVMEKEATEDAALMAGTRAEDVHSRSVQRTIRARLPWLVATFVAGLGSLYLINAFQDDLIERWAVAVTVLPIIMGLSGNVGTQASSVTVRGIAVGEIDYRRIWSVLRKELASGFVFSLVFGVLLYTCVLFLLPAISDLTGVAFAWPVGYEPERAALIPAIAIFATILTGATTGTLVPMLLHRLGRDPAVASSPFISTMNDLVGITILVVVVNLILA